MKKKEIKDILLVYPHLNTGGIETLIVRMVKWLSKNNYNVTLFLQKGGHLLNEIQGLDNINIIIYEKPSRFIRYANMYFLINKYFKNKKFDLVYSFTPSSFLLSYLVSANIRLSGVYHPLAYDKSRKSIVQSLYKVDANFSKKLIFMNKSVKNNTEKFLEKDLTDFIFPIPINIDNNNKLFGSINSKKIVSIGRITYFKTYNFYMIDVMEELVKKYPDYTYHIYGYGEDEEELKQKINNSLAKENIFFHGRISYNKIPNILNDCFAFVGMGTSLIESCSYGIPGITALVNDRNAETYGFFNKLPGYVVGSDIDGMKKYKVINKLEELINMNEEKYKSICISSKEKANEFDINNVMQKFMNDISSYSKSKDSNGDYKKLNYFKYIYFCFRKKYNL
ncbi:glycosyltransferase [Halanaerobium congolense]|uniref:glycosyltransferase n=1 Tax=Halanaerobium congolense TaxID=54121 RepID=UPI00105FD51F|nr:glycosyltransferase [Halanaerobium congolense]TDP11585.1 glycosyltransferase involved in cell wall biosynthesis [Halanaerobium congolense]